MPTPFVRTTRALGQSRGTLAVLAWAGVALGLTLWLGWAFAARVQVTETSRSARLEVRQAAHPLAAELTGRIVRQALTLGAEVRTGDLLVQLDDTRSVLRLREEQARLAGIAPQIQALTQEIAAREQARRGDQQAQQSAMDAARARLAEAGSSAGFAAEQARRLADDSTSGGTPRIDADRARADSQRLQAGRDALAADLQRTAADAIGRDQQHRAQVEALNRTLAALRGDAEASRNAIQRLAAEIEQHQLRAPVSGRIAELAPLRPGELVQAGQRLASVVPSGDWVVVADFNPAAALGRVRPGQRARLVLDGFPWAQYGSIDATVARVAGEVRDQGVRVELQLQGPLPAGIQAQHGLPGAVQVQIEQLAPAQLVLRAAGLQQLAQR